MLIKTLAKVLKKPSYAGLTLIVTLVAFAFSVLLPNFSAIGAVFSSSANLSSKFLFLSSLFGSIKTNFTVVSATYTIIIDILFGLNIALFVYYFRKARADAKASGVGMGIGGMISGIFGIGCASCGTFVLTGLLGLFGAAGLISYLPFGGVEFGYLGVVLLAFSVYIVLKKINAPTVCKT